MYPMDGSQTGDFVGVDYTAHMRGPSIYDADTLTGRVLDAIEEYLTSRGLASRRCFPSAFGSAATGPPAFYEILQWVQENWGFLTGIASALLAQVAVTRAKLYRLKRKMDDRILDPYKPSVVVELGVRTGGEKDNRQQEAIASFRSLLTHVPEIDERLRAEIPDQKFTIRVLSSNYSNPYAYFKVAKVKPSDIAKMMRYLSKPQVNEGVGAVLLYRKFGFLTRLQASRNPQEFMDFTMR